MSEAEEATATEEPLPEPEVPVDDTEPAEDQPPDDEGDEAVHEPDDGGPDPAEPGAGLGDEVEQPDEEA